jgi:hypothetical protein
MGTLGPGDIHHALTQGPGTGSFQEARAASASLAASHQERESQAMTLVMKMGAAWTGDASEAARAGAAPLLRAFRDGQEALARHQDLMGRQTESFGVAKTSVHDVPNEPPSASFGDMVSDASGLSLFTGGGYVNKVQEWSDKANANVTAYSNYANASSYNRTNMPNEYGDPSGSSSDVALTQQPGTGGPGPGGTGSVHGPGGTGGPNAPVSHYSGGPGSSQWTPNGTGTPGPGTGGLPNMGTGSVTTTSTQGWPAGSSTPATGGGWPTPTGGAPGGTGMGGGGEGGAFPGGMPFGGGGGAGGYGTGSGGGTTGGTRGFRGGGMAGTGGTAGAGGAAAEGKVVGPGARAGAGMPGAGGTTVAAGRPGAPGAQGASGLPGGAQGRKEEDKEHKSAAYLEDDYSDELIGELPRTTPTVIGLD